MKWKFNMVTPRTSAKWRVDERLISRQMQARAVVVRNGKNVDRSPINYDQLPIG